MLCWEKDKIKQIKKYIQSEQDASYLKRELSHVHQRPPNSTFSKKKQQNLQRLNTLYRYQKAQWERFKFNLQLN